MSKKYIYHEKCNICNSTRRTKLFSIGRQNLLKCSKCGLVYFDKQRSDLETLYDKKYFSLEDGIEYANYADYNIQEKTVKKNFAFAFEFIKQNIRRNGEKLLEIGPGFGYFLKHLPDNVESEGAEVSHIAVNHVRKMGLRVFEGDFQTINLKRGYMCVVAFDVIEHQLYLKEFIEKIHLLLNPGGYFIFTTPDYGTILNKVFGRSAPTIQPNYHNYYFSQKWLQSNMPGFEFKIVSMNTTYMNYLSIAQILLLGSFAFPILKDLRLLEIAKKLRIDSRVIPFFRFGGIECIARKIDERNQ